MLSLRSHRLLPALQLDGAQERSLAERGFAWQPLQIGSVACRWLYGPQWRASSQAAALPYESLRPVMGFRHSAAQACVTLYHAQVAYDFDPGDFLDVNAAIRFEAASKCRVNGTDVAERIGVHKGAVLSLAAHRFGRDLFVVHGQVAPAECAMVLPELRLFNVGLVSPQKTSVLQPLRLYISPNTPLAFSCPQAATVLQRGDGDIVRLAMGRDTAEITVSVRSLLGSPQDVIANEWQWRLRQGLRVDRPSKRSANVAAPGLQSPLAVCVANTQDGEERMLACGELRPGLALFVEAAYPARQHRANAWMATRHAIGQVLQSVQYRSQ